MHINPLEHLEQAHDAARQVRIVLRAAGNRLLIDEATDLMDAIAEEIKRLRKDKEANDRAI